MIESNLNTTKSKFDHKNNWENYNLEVSAYQKRKKGRFKSSKQHCKSFRRGSNKKLILKKSFSF